MTTPTRKVYNQAWVPADPSDPRFRELKNPAGNIRDHLGDKKNPQSCSEVTLCVSSCGSGACGPGQKCVPYQIPSHTPRAVRPQGDWCEIAEGQKLLRWEASTGSPGGPARPTLATPPGRSALGLAGWPGRCSERRREEPGAPATQNHGARSPAAVAALTAARAL